MTILRAVLICSILFSIKVLAKTVNPAELNECVYSYWSNRVNGGVIDAQFAQDSAYTALFPNVSANAVAQQDVLAQPRVGSAYTANVTLTQQLINISQWANIHAKNLSEKGAQFDWEDQLLTLMRSATTSFFSQVQSAKRVKLLQKRVSRLARAVTLAKETKRLRLADPSAVYLALADKEALDISIASAEADAVSALNILKSTIGFSEGELSLDDNYTPQVSTELSYWTKKIDELPSIQVLKSKAEASEASATASRDQIIPSLALSGQLSQPMAGPTPAGTTGLVSLTLTLPLFDQGLRSATTQQAESQKMLAEAQILSKREALLAEIKNLLNQFEVDKKIAKIAQDQFDNSKKGYDALITLFPFGKANFLEIRDSESALVDAEIQLENIQSKLVGDKTVLELLSSYSSGKRRLASSKVRCPTR